MVRQMDKLLKDLGWVDGFHIPVANEENKALEVKVEQKFKEKGELTVKLDSLTKRIEGLLKHAENLKNEQKQAQAILTAHRNEIQTEETMYRLAENDKESYQRELRNINKSFQELGERHLSLQKDIFKHTEKLEQLKTSVKWDKEAITTWDEEISRQTEDNEVIGHFSKEDENKIKELELTRQRLRVEVETRHKLVNEMCMQVSTLETILDKTADLFRKAHAERQALIRQWEDSVRVLHQRDESTTKMIQEMDVLRSLARDKLEVLKENEGFLESQVNENKELEEKISLLTRQYGRMRQDYNNLQNCIKDIASELAALQHQLGGDSTRLQNQRLANTKLVGNIHEKEVRLLELTHELEAVRNRMKEVMENSASASDRARQLEDLIQREENTMKQLTTDTQRLNDMLYRVQQELYAVRDIAKKQEINSLNCIKTRETVKKRAQQVEQELLTKKDSLYNLEYETFQLESRIEFLTVGTANAEEKEAMNRKIAELETVLNEKNATYNLLVNQNQRLDDRMRRLAKAIENDKEELDRLQDKKQDQILLAEGGQKQLKLFTLRSQEKQVEENVLQLRVAQAMKAMAREGDQVFSLEKQRLELEAAMKERQLEIGINKDLLMVKKRALEEERSKLLAEINGREMRISQLQKKYDIAMASLGHDEDGEPYSVTYFKIKNAQEKYALQQEGDNLDTTIRKMEKEILAMENTLKIVNTTNDTFRRNLSAVDEDSDEYKQKEELEKEYFELTDLLRLRQSQLKQLKVKTQGLEEVIDRLYSGEESLRKTLRNKDQEASDMDKDLQEQANKLQRAEQQLRKTLRDMRNDSEPKPTSLEEKDIEVREYQEQNQSALQQLAELVARYIETGPVVTRYLEEKGLSLPTITSSRDRLTTPSTRASRQSVQSQDSRASYDSMKKVITPSSSRLSVSVHCITPPSLKEDVSMLSLKSGQSSPTVVNLDPDQLSDGKPTSYTLGTTRSSTTTPKTSKSSSATTPKRKSSKKE